VHTADLPELHLTAETVCIIALENAAEVEHHTHAIFHGDFLPERISRDKIEQRRLRIFRASPKCGQLRGLGSVVTVFMSNPGF